MQLKGNVLDCAPGRKVLDLEDGVADGAIHLREHIGHFAADHERNQLILRQILGTVGGNVFAVAVDGDVIGNTENLIHLVGDVNNGDVLRLQLGDDAEQVLNLRVGQRRRRFVHDDNFAVIGNRLRDLDHLHFRDRKVAHLCVGVYIEPQLLEQRNAVLAHLLMVDHEPVFQRDTAQPQVFSNAAFGHRRQFLMDHRNPRVQRLKRRLVADFFALKDDFAARGRVDTDQALHERRLACAVLAHQRMHRARPYLELHAFQGAHARKFLHDIGHFQDILLTHFFFTSVSFICGWFPDAGCIRSRRGRRPGLPASALQGAPCAGLGRPVRFLRKGHCVQCPFTYKVNLADQS